jgi:hypothetical protein
MVSASDSTISSINCPEIEYTAAFPLTDLSNFSCPVVGLGETPNGIVLASILITLL